MRRALVIVFLVLPVWTGTAPAQTARDENPLRDFLRLAEGILGLEVATGRTTGPDADARLAAAGQGFLDRGASPAELVALQGELRVASGQFFTELEREIQLSTSWPSILPVTASRALAFGVLRATRSKFDQAIQRGENPLPLLAAASRLLAKARGFVDLPAGLDRFADASDRADRMAATLGATRPPTVMGTPGGPTMGSPGMPATGRPPGAPGMGAPGAPGMGTPGTPGMGAPPAVGTTGAPGMGSAGGPGMGSAGAPGMGSAGGQGRPPAAPGGPVGMGSGSPPPSTSSSAGPSGPSAPGPLGAIPRATPGVGSPIPPVGSAIPPVGSTIPPMGSASPGGPGSSAIPPASSIPPMTSASAPPATFRAPLPPRRPTVITMSSGTIEAESRYLGISWSDVVGSTPEFIGDGLPDTEIELKISTPGLILDWIEVRSAPDPTFATWTTQTGNETGMVGLAQHGLVLNKETGSVGGLAIDDLVVLSLYVQDDGLLDRLDEPGTIRIGFRGGDIATISIAPAR